jgi:hypothetical protein
MIAPYLLRLLCLCLAAFFVIHFVVGLAITLAGPAAVRAARRMRPRSAERFLLALRLLPSLLALFLVAGLCVPSYLWLEPETNAEEIGIACLSSALLAAAIWTISIVPVASAPPQGPCAPPATANAWVDCLPYPPHYSLSGPWIPRPCSSRWWVSLLPASRFRVL